MIKKSDLIDIIDSFNLPTNVDFPDDKLAYLALTSKVELRLRDAIAYQINRKLQDGEFVCREWKYIDAAVVDINNDPRLLIECKSHNSIDFHGFLVNKSKGNPMAKDILKLKYHSQKRSADLYYIFFNNVTKSSLSLPADPIGKDIFAYRFLVNRLIHLPYKDKVLIVFKNWVDLLKRLNLPLGLTTAVEIYAGTYRGIEASVIAFVYGPFKDSDVTTISGETFEGSDLDSIKPGSSESNGNDDLNEITDFRYHDETLKDILSDLKKHLQSSNNNGIMKNAIKLPRQAHNNVTITIDRFPGDKKGLRKGDRVVISVNGVLKSGTIVRIFDYPAMNRKEATIRCDDGTRIFRLEDDITKI